MAEVEKKNSLKCKQCQFYNKKEDNCMVKSIKEFNEYSRKGNNNCRDFVINDKLIMY